MRGCIGYTRQLKPLSETVIEMAQAAAFQDPRFAPLAAREWGDISIEISALTPLRLIQEVKEQNNPLSDEEIRKDPNPSYPIPNYFVEISP